MAKHLVVALAATLSVAGLSARPILADRAIVVQPGETMQSISRRYYGDDEHILAITVYNHLQSPDQIFPGLQLILPELPPDDRAAATFTLPVLRGPASPDAPRAMRAQDPDPPAAAADVAVPGRPIQSGLATWYGPGFVGNVTYCGEIYDEWAFTAASNTLSCGTVVIVTNQDTGASVRVRITDRGGFGGNVIMDLSRAAFNAIAPSWAGVVAVTVSQPAQ